tara:strand:+ start:624 stop:824 length:201 start_codon:yes stop_codon:yes gene_type:complete
MFEVTYFMFEVKKKMLHNKRNLLLSLTQLGALRDARVLSGAPTIGIGGIHNEENTNWKIGYWIDGV